MTAPEFYDPQAWVNDPEIATHGHRPLIPIVDHGPVEVYLRNANEFANLLREYPHDKFCFTASDMKAKSIIPYDFLASVCPSAMDFAWTEVYSNRVVLQTRSGHEAETPPLLVPLWTAKTDPDVLLRWCEVAADRGYSRIATGWMSWLDSTQQARYHEWIYRIAATHPQIKFHHTLGASYRNLFGLNYASVDFNPSYAAARDCIVLPNGNRSQRKVLATDLKWIHVLGFAIRDLATYEGRVLFNIASALWAAENYRKAEPITRAKGEAREDPLSIMNGTATAGRVRASMKARPALRQKLAIPYLNADDFPQTSPDPDEPYHYALPVTNTQPIPIGPRKPQSGDKIVCNACSLAPSCKVYREGAVCAVSDSDTARLATMFGTRDTDTLKSVLSEILARQVERYERSAVKFREDSESDVFDLKRSEHLMKMENSLVRSTETLMKILDPQFRESNIPAIVGSQTNIYNPRVLVADVVRQLEERGYAREQITPALIQEVVGDKQIEG